MICHNRAQATLKTEEPANGAYKKKRKKGQGKLPAPFSVDQEKRGKVAVKWPPELSFA